MQIDTESSSALIAYEGTDSEVSSPISSLSQEDALEDIMISTHEKEIPGSVDPNSYHNDTDDNSVDCEQDTDTAGASIDESTISTYDISRAVQLKKTRSLTDIEKFNFLNHHFIPPYNFKFPTKQYGSRQRSFQYAWLKKFNGLVYSADEEGAFVNSVSYLVSSVISALIHLEF